MANYEKGNRIRTESELRASFLDPVIPEGTEGTITGERHELFESYYQVQFDNGQTADIPQKDFSGDNFTRRPEMW